MEIGFLILIIVAGLALCGLGIFGCVAPGLPGPPIAYLSLLVLHFGGVYHFPTWILITLAIFAMALALVDYVVPIYGTKKMGGSKAGVRGSTAGVIVGVILTIWLGPLCIIVGPFIGAALFELMAGKTMQQSLKSGVGALVGFLIGTGAKLALAFMITLVFIISAFYGLVS